MSPVKLVSEHTHRVLAYVEALNRHGVRPHREVVNEFAADHKRKYRTTGGLVFGGMLGARATLASMMEGERVPDETFCQYLARLDWINDDTVQRVELTATGRALLKALNSPAIEESAADVIEIVLDPKNPFAYAQALSGLMSAKEALLVEPYFRLQQLMDVSEFDNIVRVLVGSNLKPQDYDLLATGLTTLDEKRPLEIRKATDLHDRYLIPADDGAVLMLGASLGGIGRKVSTMTTLGEVASRALRAAHEEIWRSAEPIKPKMPAALPSPAAAPIEAPPAEASTKKATAKKASTKKTTAKKASTKKARAKTTPALDR